jgi:hypothetical protein
MELRGLLDGMIAWRLLNTCKHRSEETVTGDLRTEGSPIDHQRRQPNHDCRVCPPERNFGAPLPLDHRPTSKEDKHPAFSVTMTRRIELQFLAEI